MANPLARIIMGNVSRSTQGTNEVRSSFEDRGNLTREDEDIIKNIIYKETRVQSNTVNKKTVTLEELAEMVKGQKER